MCPPPMAVRGGRSATSTHRAIEKGLGSKQGLFINALLQTNTLSNNM